MAVRTATSQERGQPSERRAATEASLLRATAELLEEGRPYATLSVEEIARRAGIGRTAFYFYYRDKRELLLRLVEDVGAQLLALADRWWGGHGDGLAQLREQVEPAVRLFLRNAVLLRAVADAAPQDSEVRAFWSELTERFVRATARRIEAEQRAGHAVAGPPREIALALVMMTERSCYEHARTQDGGERAEQRLVQALTGLWTRGVYGTLPG